MTNPLYLLFASVAIFPLAISYLKRNVAKPTTQMNLEGIVSILEDHGISASVDGPWIIFDHQEDVYAINTLRLPFLAIVKQTSLEEYSEYASAFIESAQAISLDVPMIYVYIDTDRNPTHRVIFQVNAVENCTTSFIQRLGIYLDILNEAERRFFCEIVQQENLQS